MWQPISNSINMCPAEESQQSHPAIRKKLASWRSAHSLDMRTLLPGWLWQSTFAQLGKLGGNWKLNETELGTRPLFFTDLALIFKPTKAGKGRKARNKIPFWRFTFILCFFFWSNFFCGTGKTRTTNRSNYFALTKGFNICVLADV